MFRFIGSAILSGWLLGCAASPPAKAALEGSLPRLQEAIATAQRNGSLNAKGVHELAGAVAKRELRTASDAPAAERLRGLRPCASRLAGELTRKAEGEGEAAAAATLLLIEVNQADLDALVEQHAAASEPHWRAVGARASTGPGHARTRHKLMQDGDVRVRRSALLAALRVPDPGDFEELLEVARLDPDPATRHVAIRALGSAGQAEGVLGLRDLWDTTDAAGRLAIVEAWAVPPSFAHGGERELVWVAETQGGLVGLRAALALGRATPHHQQLGHNVVHSSLQTGTSDEQRLILGLGEFDRSELSSQVLELAEHANHAAIRVAAWGRLARVPEYRQRAMVELRQLAQADREGSLEAQRMLLEFRDASVKPRLLQELAAPQSAKREQAALGLLQLGDPVAAASALGDDDPTVRLRVACTVLSSGV